MLLRTASIYWLVYFNSSALQTLSTCCLENTSIRAAAQATPDAPTTPKNTSGFTSK